jgi:hypothetical protein
MIQIFLLSIIFSEIYYIHKPHLMQRSPDLLGHGIRKEGENSHHKKQYRSEYYIYGQHDGEGGAVISFMVLGDRVRLKNAMRRAEYINKYSGNTNNITSFHALFANHITIPVITCLLSIHT